MNYFTVKEAVERLKVTEKTMAKWLRDGRFPHAEKNGKWRIPECCLEGHKEATAEEAKSEEETKPDPELVKLQHEVERLKVEKEVKELKAEIAGIFGKDDQDKIAQAQEKLLVDATKLAERKGVDSARLAELEQELRDKEDKVTAAQDELAAAQEDLKAKQANWEGILKMGENDLRKIHEYYQGVCAKWHVKEEVVLPLLELEPGFYTQSFEASLKADKLKEDEDEEPEW